MLRVKIFDFLAELLHAPLDLLEAGLKIGVHQPVEPLLHGLILGWGLHDVRHSRILVGYQRCLTWYATQQIILGPWCIERCHALLPDYVVYSNRFRLGNIWVSLWVLHLRWRAYLWHDRLGVAYWNQPPLRLNLIRSIGCGLCNPCRFNLKLKSTFFEASPPWIFIFLYPPLSMVTLKFWLGSLPLHAILTVFYAYL